MIQVKETVAADLPAIRDIYNYYIENSVITFEEVAWDDAAMQHKFDHIKEDDYPFFSCYDGDQLVGYYYLSSWNFRSAYSTTAEVTIYLAPSMTGRGYGRALYEHLLATTDRQRFHSLIACITIPNEPSIALHERFGFVQVSSIKEIGFKHDKWCDVGHWQLILEKE